MLILLLNSYANYKAKDVPQEIKTNKQSHYQYNK